MRQTVKLRCDRKNISSFNPRLFHNGRNLRQRISIAVDICPHNLLELKDCIRHASGC